jgi:arabinan endo-1,5-alpha-L-arabinosidase
MVFCQEWTQVGDGLMMGMELRRDLRTAVGAPFRLFAASEAPWAKPFNSSSSSHASNLITDGPYLFRSRGSGNSTELLMLWSSIGANGQYSVGVARSPGGSLRGPWTHDPQPLFAADGGHAMVARLGLSLGGKAGAPPQHTLAVLALHSPNRKVAESAPRLLGLIEELDAATGCAKLDLFDFLVH